MLLVACINTIISRRLFTWLWRWLTTAQLFETSVTNNSISEDYPHLDDHTRQTTVIYFFLQYSKKRQNCSLSGLSGRTTFQGKRLHCTLGTYSITQSAHHAFSKGRCELKCLVGAFSIAWPTVSFKRFSLTVWATFTMYYFHMRATSKKEI